MRTNWLAMLALGALVIGCGNRTTPFGNDAGDATTTDGARTCTSNADCDDHTACTADACLVGGVCSNSPIAGACDAGMCVSGVGCTTGTTSCMSMADCNDHIDCTSDACLVGGVCQHTANSNLCPVGQMCTAHGCAAGCMTMADCDDHFDCTIDTCQANGTCIHTAQNNRCTAPQVCNTMMGCVSPSGCQSDMQCDDHVYCNGVEHCQNEISCMAGTAVDCTPPDGGACVIGMCNEAMHACTYMPNPSCSTMVHSGIYSVTPVVNYSCAFAQYHLRIDTMQFAISGGTLTVTGAMAPMTSPAPTGASFHVMGDNLATGGGCDEHYDLMGMFTDATHFTGTLTVSFSDSLGGSACFDCSMHSFHITGTGG